VSTKGSWSRVKDLKAWSKNWDRAFKKKHKGESMERQEYYKYQRSANFSSCPKCGKKKRFMVRTGKFTKCDCAKITRNITINDKFLV